MNIKTNILSKQPTSSSGKAYTSAAERWEHEKYAVLCLPKHLLLLSETGYRANEPLRVWPAKPFLCTKHSEITEECSIPQDIMNMQKHSWNSGCSFSFALKFMIVYRCFSAIIPQGTLWTKYRDRCVSERLWITWHLKNRVPRPSPFKEYALPGQQ